MEVNNVYFLDNMPDTHHYYICYVMRCYICVSLLVSALAECVAILHICQQYYVQYVVMSST